VVWDAGEFLPLDTDDPEQSLKNGKLSFALAGKKLKGAFALAQMKGLPKATGKEWLLMKKKDAHAKAGYRIETALTPARLKKLKERVPPCETE
jgi:bifunctional non-homologous end joining protein LigD